MPKQSLSADISVYVGGSTSNAVRLATSLQECLDLPIAEDRMLFVVGTADSASDVAAPLRRIFTHELTAGELLSYKSEII